MTDVHAAEAKIRDARRHLEAARDLLLSANTDTAGFTSRDRLFDLWAGTYDVHAVTLGALARVARLDIPEPVEVEPNKGSEK